jgi:ribosomal protein S18 acetylase RimI-like enzyme
MLSPAVKATVELAVVEEYRSQGVGTALLTAAAEWATAAGLTSLVLDASVANRAALALYERWGYRPFGTLTEKPVT